jgi:hypothetical protein
MSISIRFAPRLAHEITHDRLQIADPLTMLRPIQERRVIDRRGRSTQRPLAVR